MWFASGYVRELFNSLGAGAPTWIEASEMGPAVSTLQWEEASHLKRNFVDLIKVVYVRPFNCSAL